jgi:NAD(P)-dependent dehydrogenase (short-subunit alcohol dehydrogenase family)
MPKLEGRVALVTGSAQGMGAGIARLLHAEGARIMLHGLEEAQGKKFADELSATGPVAAFCGGNLADDNACKRLIDTVGQQFGALDILVNCAGDTSRGTIDSTDVQLWDRIFAVNVRAPFLLIKFALPLLRRTQHASIVNIGSVNAYIGEPKLTAYSASKGALMTLTRNLAAALNQERIRVNLINPGWTLTEGEQRIKREVEGKSNWLEDAIRTRPFGRLLTPEDTARAVLFFASDETQCITGSVLDYEQYPVGAPPNW